MSDDRAANDAPEDHHSDSDEPTEVDICGDNLRALSVDLPEAVNDTTWSAALSIVSRSKIVTQAARTDLPALWPSLSSEWKLLFWRLAVRDYLSRPDALNTNFSSDTAHWERCVLAWTSASSSECIGSSESDAWRPSLSELLALASQDCSLVRSLPLTDIPVRHFRIHPTWKEWFRSLPTRVCLTVLRAYWQRWSRSERGLAVTHFLLAQHPFLPELQQLLQTASIRYPPQLLREASESVLCALGESACAPAPFLPHGADVWFALQHGQSRLLRRCFRDPSFRVLHQRVLETPPVDSSWRLLHCLSSHVVDVTALRLSWWAALEEQPTMGGVTSEAVVWACHGPAGRVITFERLESMLVRLLTAGRNQLALPVLLEMQRRRPLSSIPLLRLSLNHSNWMESSPSTVILRLELEQGRLDSHRPRPVHYVELAELGFAETLTRSEQWTWLSKKRIFNAFSRGQRQWANTIRHALLGPAMTARRGAVGRVGSKGELLLARWHQLLHPGGGPLDPSPARTKRSIAKA